MKQIINGKRYNTDTATLLHEWSNDYYGNDFRWCEESLYKTKSGNYFLTGSGGPMSKYSRSCGSNTVCGGSGLEPISRKEAITWLEDHDGTEELEEHFGTVIQDA
jgi:hypothetical protein